MKYEDGFHWAGGVVERKTQELNYDNNMVTYLAGSKK